MSSPFPDCHFCGGAVQEQLQTRELRHRGELVLFENVPMGVCNQCGERFIHPDVAERIDAMLERNQRPARTIEVSVYSFAEKVA